MPSDVQIVNIALARIGVSQGIASFTERSIAAQQASLLYAPMRDQVLSEFAWPFAQKYADLALVEQEPNVDWLYSYRQPVDCLRAHRVIDSEAGASASTFTELIAVSADRRESYPFAIASDTAGVLLFTDLELAALHYTRRVETTSLFDASFVSALAWCLAAELAVPLSVDATRMDQARAYYQQAIAQARAAAGNAGHEWDRPGEFVSGRW